MANIVSEFYHDVQFPGHYTQNEVLEKSDDFFLSEFMDLDFLPYQGKILEVGCGTGYTTHVLANTRRDVKIEGVDLVMLFGANNKKFERLSNLFPSLKIIAPAIVAVNS